MRALPPTLGNGSSCDLERDDDGDSWGDGGSIHFHKGGEEG